MYTSTAHDLQRRTRPEHNGGQNLALRLAAKPGRGDSQRRLDLRRGRTIISSGLFCFDSQDFRSSNNTDFLYGGHAKHLLTLPVRQYEALIPWARADYNGFYWPHGTLF